jgi:hypothetical protein
MQRYDVGMTGRYTLQDCNLVTDLSTISMAGAVIWVFSDVQALPYALDPFLSARITTIRTVVAYL